MTCSHQVSLQMQLPCIRPLRVPSPPLLVDPPRLHCKYFVITPVSALILSPVILENEQSSVSSIRLFH